MITQELDTETNGRHSRQWLAVSEPAPHPGGVRRSNTLSPVVIMRIQADSKMQIWRLPLSSSGTMGYDEVPATLECTWTRRVLGPSFALTHRRSGRGPARAGDS